MKKISYKIEDFTLTHYYGAKVAVYTKEIIKEAYDLLPDKVKDSEFLTIQVIFDNEKLNFGYSMKYSDLDLYQRILDEVIKLI